MLPSAPPSESPPAPPPAYTSQPGYPNLRRYPKGCKSANPSGLPKPKPDPDGEPLPSLPLSFWNVGESLHLMKALRRVEQSSKRECPGGKRCRCRYFSDHFIRRAFHIDGVAAKLSNKFWPDMEWRRVEGPAVLLAFASPSGLTQHNPMRQLPASGTSVEDGQAVQVSALSVSAPSERVEAG